LNTKTPHLDKFNQPDFIARLRVGDKMAYQNLVDELTPWFSIYINRKFGINKEDAKDIVPDAILTIYRKIRRYQSVKGKFVQWTFVILRNLCLDWLKKRHKEHRTLRDLVMMDWTIASEGKDVHDDLSILERLPFEVQEAILRLPGRYQQFVGLMLLGASESYIMGIMQIKTRSAFRSLKSRVLTKLRIAVQQTK
jgi:DNA-directed RNA polymerase specialized sigma24 family protein